MALSTSPRYGQPKIKDTAQIAERLNDAEWRMGGPRNVDPPVHALHYGDQCRVFGQIALPGKKDLRGAKLMGVFAAQVEQPLDPFVYTLAVN